MHVESKSDISGVVNGVVCAWHRRDLAMAS